ncbi:hypothetical protein [Nocardiopsis sp. MG754419]|uniref:hypothetical protein n=1 Tax=Nocardiopsis sp. MG754419 TaxID=2259865 RepID=UPI001BAD5A83|nr:hypothetical protein [Nocardiopsis sp. MG754419]MBR8741574.1 hypothetical protein [Nocardiopsis sp. MG754419]
MSTKTDTRRTTKGRGRTGTTTRPAAPRRPVRGKATAATVRPGGAAGTGRAPKIPFVLLILCLLGAALISLLVLRSVVAQEAYTITSLQSENREMSYEEQRLEESVAHLETSERIAQEAEEMGMEPGDAPLFLDVDNGEITGDAGSDD